MGPPHAQWEEGFSYLLSYTEREGHARVPKQHVEDAYRLGSWVCKQRGRYGRGALGSDEIRRLEELPGWTWNARADRWEEGFSYLHGFAEREGHARVPHDHVEDGFRLGRWVIKLRSRKDILAPGRIRQLEELPGWTWNPHTEGGRKDSATCCVSSNAKATPAYRLSMWKTATNSGSG